MPGLAIWEGGVARRLLVDVLSIGLEEMRGGLGDGVAVVELHWAWPELSRARLSNCKKPRGAWSSVGLVAMMPRTERSLRRSRRC